MLELEQVNKALSAAIDEKDALLKEIHHRVKNNMQVINSMISLQLNDNIKTMTPDEIITVAFELENRIRAMALVHDILYNSKNLSKINFNEYINNLMGSLFNVYNIKNELITATIQVTDEPVTIATALPMGQIINELLTNALKYAFPPGRKGHIKITITIDNDRTFKLTVSDNGIGLPDDFNIDSVRSFGMHLVSILVKQLDGSIHCSNDNGAVFDIHFRETSDDNKFSSLEI